MNSVVSPPDVSHDPKKDRIKMADWLKEKVNSHELKAIVEDFATAFSRKRFNTFLRRLHHAVQYLSDGTSLRAGWEASGTL